MRPARSHQRFVRARHWTTLGVCVLGLSAGAMAAAEGLDPSRPWAIAIGTAEGPSPSDRLDPERAGLSHEPLPAAPSELWRRELPGGLDFMPLVTADGSIIAVLANRMVASLAPNGEERWRLPLPSMDVAAPPLLGLGGVVMVLGTEGELAWIGPGPRIARTTALRTATRRAEAAPQLGDDGSLYVAGEAELLHVEPNGALSSRAAVTSLPVGGLLPWQGATLATLESGDVVGWRPPAEPRLLGHLPERPQGGGVLVGQRSLAAVVGASSVVVLDLATGVVKPLVVGEGTMGQLEGPPTLLPTGELAVATVVGELLVVDVRGQITRRIALDNASLLAQPDAGTSFFGRLDLTPSPPLLADRTGRVAFVRATGRLGLLAPGDGSGRVAVAAPRFCGRALGVTSGGKGRLLVACRNGSIGMFADAD